MIPSLHFTFTLRLTHHLSPPFSLFLLLFQLRAEAEAAAAAEAARQSAMVRVSDVYDDILAILMLHMDTRTAVKFGMTFKRCWNICRGHTVFWSERCREEWGLPSGEVLPVKIVSRHSLMALHESFSPTSPVLRPPESTMDAAKRENAAKEAAAKEAEERADMAANGMLDHDMGAIDEVSTSEEEDHDNDDDHHHQQQHQQLLHHDHHEHDHDSDLIHLVHRGVGHHHPPPSVDSTVEVSHTSDGLLAVAQRPPPRRFASDAQLGGRFGGTTTGIIPDATSTSSGEGRGGSGTHGSSYTFPTTRPGASLRVRHTMMGRLQSAPSGAAASGVQGGPPYGGPLTWREVYIDRTKGFRSSLKMMKWLVENRSPSDVSGTK